MINRRSLLSLIGLAPIAAPALAVAPVARFASGGYVGPLMQPYVFGEGSAFLVPGEMMVMRMDPGEISRAFQRELDRLNVSVKLTEMLDHRFVDGDGI